MNRAKLDILLDKLQADGFYEHFLLLLKMLNGGVRLEKKVGGAAGGNCGQVFIPRRFVGQVCDVLIIPKDGELIALQEAVHEAQKKLKVQRKKLALLKEQKGNNEVPLKEPEEEEPEIIETGETEDTY